MRKIPVGATIAHAYHFAFADFLTVFKAIWLPLAAYAALSIPMMGRMMQLMASLGARDPAALSAIGPLFLLYPFLLILIFMQFLAVSEAALGVRPNDSWFYFPLGKKLWRLIGGVLLALLAIIALMLCYALIAFVLGFVLNTVLKSFVSAAMATGLTGVFAALLFLVAYGVLIFLTIRFFFLLAPASIVEQRLGVGRSWQLTRGNFWRAFLVTLSIVLPLVVIEYAAIFSFAGFPAITPGMSPQAVQAANLAWNIALFSAIVRYWYIIVPAVTVVLVLYFGAACGAQAFAYRALTEDEAAAAVAFD
ncbi:MAG: hypothetical protein H0U98_02995 [Alphaproteobacteria bacterium]|nr:hypothetical protein [Alphaproteobacteria bacterium]